MALSTIERRRYGTEYPICSVQFADTYTGPVPLNSGHFDSQLSVALKGTIAWSCIWSVDVQEISRTSEWHADRLRRSAYSVREKPLLCRTKRRNRSHYLFQGCLELQRAGGGAGGRRCAHKYLIAAVGEEHATTSATRIDQASIWNGKSAV